MGFDCSPVYWVRCSILEDKDKCEADALAKTIASRQYAEWRELRFADFGSAEVRKAFASLAEQIAQSLGRAETRAPQNAGSSKPAVQKTQDAKTTKPNPKKNTSRVSGAAREPKVRNTQPTDNTIDQVHRIGDHAAITEIRSGTQSARNCRDEMSNVAVLLGAQADPCPWPTGFRALRHIVDFQNHRANKLYNVTIYSKSLHNLTDLDGNSEVIQFYRVIGAMGKAKPMYIITPKAGSSGQTDEILTVATFRDEFANTVDEKLTVSYCLEIP
jgi:hypothetical protein